MQVSAELRWFIDASHAAQVHAFGDWFEAGPYPPGGGKLRIDLYAAEPAVDLGAKQRGGKSELELKVLACARLCSIQVGARTASAQLWSKVSSEVLIMPAEDAKRRALHKRRSLRKYALVGDAVESSIARTLRTLEHRLEDAVPEITEAVLTVSEPDGPGTTSS